MPGDRATALMNQQTGQEKRWTAEELAPLNEKFGFDDPIAAQYLHYLAGLARGDRGTSYTQNSTYAIAQNLKDVWLEKSQGEPVFSDAYFTG